MSNDLSIMQLAKDIKRTKNDIIYLEEYLTQDTDDKPTKHTIFGDIIREYMHINEYRNTKFKRIIILSPDINFVRHYNNFLSCSVSPIYIDNVYSNITPHDDKYNTYFILDLDNFVSIDSIKFLRKHRTNENNTFFLITKAPRVNSVIYRFSNAAFRHYPQEKTIVTLRNKCASTEKIYHYK